MQCTIYFSMEKAMFVIFETYRKRTVDEPDRFGKLPLGRGRRTSNVGIRWSQFDAAGLDDESLGQGNSNKA